MPQTLQVLQILLFSIPIAALIGVGLVILIRPVSVINRRWMLWVFLPLLLANTVAIFANDTFSTVAILRDWRLWLVVLADVGLSAVIVVVFRGYSVYGLSAAATSEALTDAFHNQGYEMAMTQGQRRLLGSGMQDALVLSVSRADQEDTIWITSGSGEVVVRAGHRRGALLLKSVLAALRAQETPYDFRSHAMGVLYLVFAVVFAVLIWIFFFEPRLILIE